VRLSSYDSNVVEDSHQWTRWNFLPLFHRPLDWLVWVDRQRPRSPSIQVTNPGIALPAAFGAELIDRGRWQPTTVVGGAGADTLSGRKWHRPLGFLLQRQRRHISF